MSDIRLVWDGSGADCAVRLADLEREDDIETAVILSLMLDARSRDDDALPDSLPSAGGDRRGWWADSVAPEAEGDRTGSRLWLLSREKTLPEVLNRAGDYAEEALAWLIEDGAARSVSVTADMPRKGLLALSVVITLPDGGEKHINMTRRL